MPPPPKSVSSGEPSPPSADHADSPESIEADLDASDSVEGYESDSDSAASTSLASSVRDYVFENNRRYHKFKEGRYLIPNDDIEQEREDMKHTMCLHVANNNLHFAPLDHPQKILDLGTGTGIWAIDSKYYHRFGSSLLILIISSGGRIPQRRDYRHRPQPHPTVIRAAQRQVLRRRRRIGMDRQTRVG